MGFSFISSDREQGYLMPSDMREWLAEGDPSRFIVDVVTRLDRRADYIPIPMNNGMTSRVCMGVVSGHLMKKADRPGNWAAERLPTWWTARGAAAGRVCGP